MNRVYSPEPLAARGQPWLRGEPGAHIARVLRLRAGDPLVVFDGRGGEYPARIVQLRKQEVLVELGEHRPIDRESALALTLVQGISRGERMDWVVQKATELGVHRILPVITERTVVRLGAEQAQRRYRHWQAITIAACEQCGRNVLPELALPQVLDAALAGLPAGARRLLLSPGGTLNAGGLQPATEVAVLIGPEGGLSEQEQAQARASGFEPLALGPRILRTETAAVAALAILQQRLGDL